MFGFKERRDKNNHFTDRTKRRVWAKIPKLEGHPDGMTKKDKYGRTIKFEDHGRRDKGTGWEIDHIKPVSKGGSDRLSNLQPLQWGNNKRKSNRY